MSDVSAISAQTGANREVIVVGAGFGGIYAVHRFRNQGLDVLCLEAAPDVGGVWYHNAYPGARCDLLSVDYSFPFPQNCSGNGAGRNAIRRSPRSWNISVTSPIASTFAAVWSSTPESRG